MNTIYDELLFYMENLPVISTHSHHMNVIDSGGLDLDALLRNSYVNWCGVPFDETLASRRDFLDKVRYNSYFIWLQKSLQAIYHMDEPLTAENWDVFSNKIREANKDTGKHIELLKSVCRYEKIILDAYWDPGSNNGYPELFTPAFRVNMFFFGYSPEVEDHSGKNALRIYNKEIKDIDEYVAFMRYAIQEKKQLGCVALKSAIAYDRGLDFTEATKDQAQKALGCKGHMADTDDIKAFQDYIFFQVCKIAAEFDLPFQCHTGLGKLEKSNAMWLQEAIVKNPDTKFVLFHCSYPWLDDVNGLLHLYPNVYPDLCWLPLISTSAAVRMLHELIEVGTIDKICWGCDTWTSEESYGALLAIRQVLADVLTDKINAGYLNLNDALVIADNLLLKNARKLYKL